MTADFGVSCGHTEYSNIRFENETRHMVIFETVHDLPELQDFRLELPIPYWDMPYRVRLFLTDAAYKTIRLWVTADKVRILHHANVVNGYLVDDRKRKKKIKHPTMIEEENKL